MSSSAVAATRKKKSNTSSGPVIHRVAEHTVEIVSDSGEGAQKCGQIFGMVSARMGNGAWTVEIIPAEIQPPARSPNGASGNRIRIGTKPVTNWGDAANLVVAFNEQVLAARHRLDSLHEDAIILIENMWATHEDEDIRVVPMTVPEALALLDGGSLENAQALIALQWLAINENKVRAHWGFEPV